MKELYENIKRICRKKNITVFDLEVKAGLPYNTLTRWGKSNPGIEGVKQVADALETTIDQLVRRTH